MSIDLQNIFNSEEGERAYTADVAALIASGRLAEADAKLRGDLAQIPSELAALCLATSASAVEVTGWDEVVFELKHYEGDPITALAITMGNEVETTMTKLAPLEPELEVAFIADETFPFSTASRDEILAENTSYYTPWQGKGEDIEAYLEVAGLAELNSALLNHKHRVFLRAGEDEAPVAASMEYIAYVLASLTRVLRFHQAVRAQMESQGLPGAIQVILATNNIKPFIGSVLYPEKNVESAQPALAELTIKRQYVEPKKAVELTGTAIRRQVAEAESEQEVISPAPIAAKPRGFFARLFGLR